MKVNKISNNIVQIILTEEELYFDYDLNIEDLASAAEREEVSKKIVDIVKTVADEQQIETSSGMQLTIKLNKDNEIMIEAVFTDEPTEHNIIGMAKLFKTFYNNMPKEFADLLIKKTCEKMSLRKEDVDKIFELMESDEVEEASNDTEDEEKDTYYVLEFDSLMDIVKLAKPLKELVFMSAVYKLKDKYYLTLYLYEDKDYNLINLISEFMLKRNDNIFEPYLIEHGEVIIDAWAIDKLAEI